MLTKRKSEQRGARPNNPLPPQSQERPGMEGDMDPPPQFLAPDYRGSGKLTDKVALITGGDSGIGKSVAVVFAREGADIAIAHLPSEKADARTTAAFVEREGRKCLRIAGDLTDPKFCQKVVIETISEYGRLDILVNNAAYQKHQKSIEDLTNDQFEKTFRTNIFAYFYMAKAAMAYLPEGGGIINTGSITGMEGSKDLLDYSATKGAIHAFTKSLAQQLIKKENKSELRFSGASMDTA